MIPDLYLIRHGETEWNAQERLQGCLDSPLTARGLAQGRAVRALVAGIEGDRLCSPQGRALETASILFGNSFRQDKRLAEIDVGAFTGLPLVDLRAAHPGVFAAPGLDWYDLCPKGEGLAALAARCRDLLDGLQRPALLVSHGITLRMIWALATGTGPDRLIDAPLEQGTVLAVSDGRSRVLASTNRLARTVD